jgi:hypothetical protein
LKMAIESQGMTQKFIYDFDKFKDSLDRLVSDLELLKLSEKFAKNRNKKHFDSSRNEVKQEEINLGDSLNDSKQHPDDSDNSRSMSSDKIVLDNIQKSIDLILLIQDEIAYQEKLKTRKSPNDTENTTTIMQDIDIINGAVGDNVTANQEDSFLKSFYSDVNYSKFDVSGVKYSVSASALEEKELKIKDLIQIVESQSKKMTEISKANLDLQTKSEKLSMKLHEVTEELDQNIEKYKEHQEIPPEEDIKEPVDEVLKKDYYKLESNFKEVKTAKDKIFKELYSTREKVDSQQKIIKDKDDKIQELELKILNIEKQAELNVQHLNHFITGMPMQSTGMMGEFNDYVNP